MIDDMGHGMDPEREDCFETTALLALDFGADEVTELVERVSDSSDSSSEPKPSRVSFMSTLFRAL